MLKAQSTRERERERGREGGVDRERERERESCRLYLLVNCPWMSFLLLLYCPGLSFSFFFLCTARRALVYTRCSHLISISSLLLLYKIPSLSTFVTTKHYFENKEQDFQEIPLLELTSFLSKSADSKCHFVIITEFSFSS